MSDFKAKKAPNSILAGALPQTPLGELTALPKPPADPIPALGPPGLETTCLPKYVSLNPPMDRPEMCRHLNQDVFINCKSVQWRRYTRAWRGPPPWVRPAYCFASVIV